MIPGPFLEWIAERQPAVGIVDKLLAEAEQGQARLFISAINVGQVYYFLNKQHSEALANTWRESWRTLPRNH